jgi:hypothetical protein
LLRRSHSRACILLFSFFLLCGYLKSTVVIFSDISNFHICICLLGCEIDWCLMCELEQHVMMLRECGGPLSPSRILLHMRNINHQIGDGSQEDAHEFLRSSKDSLAMFLSWFQISYWRC